MIKSRQRELFLRYIAKVYKQNPDLKIESDTIYDELSRFAVVGQDAFRIPKKSLVSIQVALKNRFPDLCFSNGYFWVIENRGGMADNRFHECMHDSIKLYVAIETEKLYLICEKLFNFMIEEKIIMSSKLAKNLRNDALILRVQKLEDAYKVADFLTKLDYKAEIAPNPFTFSMNDKVSITRDGDLPYNRILSIMMAEYFKYKRAGNRLGDVTEDNFRDFVKVVRDDFRDKRRNEYRKIYELDTPRKMNDFVMICDLIMGTIDGMNLDRFISYQKPEDITDNLDTAYNANDETKVKYVIDRLSSYYSVDELHYRVMKYLDTEEINYFTRKDGIRATVRNNFSRDKFKKVICKLGFDALVNASSDTKLKYGENQLRNAYELLLNDASIAAFTNVYYARSTLDLIIPTPLLLDVIKEKLENADLPYSADGLMMLTSSKSEFRHSHMSR